MLIAGTFSIDENKQASYIKREVKKLMKMVISVFIAFYMFMFLFSYSYHVHHIIMLPLAFIFIIIIAFIYTTNNIQKQNIAVETYIEINEQSISRYINKEKLNIINQIGMARNEYKYGVKYNQTILFKDISSTQINEHEIKITAVYYDLLTQEGLIIIPCELINYDEIKSMIKTNAELFKVENR